MSANEKNMQVLQQLSANNYGDFIITLEDDTCMITELSDDVLQFSLPSPYEFN